MIDINIFTCTGASQKRMEKPKEVVRPGDFYIILTKGDKNCREVIRQRKREFLGVRLWEGH